MVYFKSELDNFFKEFRGTKCNTVRKIDEDDERFNLLRMGCVAITIVPVYPNMHNANVMTPHPEHLFSRQISDYTEFDGYGIISWRDIR
jgi:hypothetical protein